MNIQELADDEDYETQQYLLRQQQINELQSKYQSKRNELQKYLNTSEEINISPRLFTYETNFSTNQSQKYSQNADTIKTEINQYEKKDLLTPTQFSSIKKKSILSPMTERKSEYLTTNSIVSEKRQSKSPLKSITYKNAKILSINHIVKRVSKEVQTQLTMSCKIKPGTKFQSFLQKILDQSDSKATQTTQQLKQKNIVPVQQTQQHFDALKRYTQRFKTETNEKINHKHQDKQTEKKNVFSKTNFETWYQNQKSKADKSQEKVFQQRLEKEKEQEESLNQKFIPQILQISENIVKQKFSGRQFMERQQQYEHYLKVKQQNREQEEINEIKSQRFQMSPISRRIMRSITPKSYRDYTSTTNTSWFGTYNINQ